MSETSHQSAWLLFTKSSRIVRANLKLFGALAIPNLILALWDFYHGISHSTDSSSFNFWNGTNINLGLHSNNAQMNTWLYAILIVASFVAGLAVYIAAIEFSAGRRPSLSWVFRRLLDKGLGLIGVTLLSGLIILMGFIFLIIPGIYLLGRLYLSEYVYVAEDIGVVEAIKKSWHLTKGHMWLVYSLLILQLIFSLFAIIPWIGALVTLLFVTLFGVAPALRYQELKKAKA